MKKFTLLFICVLCVALNAQEKPVIKNFEPFVWKSEKPGDCPFEDSKVITGLKFLGIKSGFFYGDTWYPSWASDDKLYSPWTDGNTKGIESSSSGYTTDGQVDEQGVLTRKATTGQAIISGDDPLTVSVEALDLSQADPYPYGGRYPCGSLVFNGVWYYGTYCLSPYGITRYGDTTYNWPFLGPFVGFRYSTDFGKTWVETSHTPATPIFDETGLGGHPVKIGSPHFVDFGKNMEYSPDGKAYMVAHGAEQSGCNHAVYHNSWITGDQIYLLRVTPGIENMNDPSEYEFFAGNDNNGNSVWTNDLKKIEPLLEWNENMGCVTVTYNAPLKKYLMCVTDGGNTCARMHTYILESDKLTGEWKLVTYMKNFGEQGYFLNIPSKFISDDGRIAWLLYSGNFAPDWNNDKINENPPGSHYGMVLQKIEFLFK